MDIPEGPPSFSFQLSLALRPKLPPPQPTPQSPQPVIFTAGTFPVHVAPQDDRAATASVPPRHTLPPKPSFQDFNRRSSSSTSSGSEGYPAPRRSHPIPARPPFLAPGEIPSSGANRIPLIRPRLPQRADAAPCNHQQGNQEKKRKRGDEDGSPENRKRRKDNRHATINKNLLPRDIEAGMVAYLKKNRDELHTGHPVFVFERPAPDNTMLVGCITSWAGTTIFEKWGRDINDPAEAVRYRRRFLLIQHPGAATHDGMPVLRLAGADSFPSQSYLDLYWFRRVHISAIERFMPAWRTCDVKLADVKEQYKTITEKRDAFMDDTSPYEFF